MTRTALVAGASGLVGRALLAPLLDEDGATVHALLRPIQAAVVARAMRLALRAEGLSVQVLESGALQSRGRSA